MIGIGLREVAPVGAVLLTTVSLALLGPAPPAARAAGASVCPPTESAGPEVPAPVTAPAETTIACVGSRALSEATFEHWDEIAAAGTAAGTTSPRTPAMAQALLAEAMGFLISSMWVRGEAEALKVRVSPIAVRRQFVRMRREQFRKAREFRAFLRKSKQTVADLLLRVELDMLSQRIQRRVTAGYHGAAAKKRALARFVADFRAKWTGQTYCASQYAVKDCGHVQASL